MQLGLLKRGRVGGVEMGVLNATESRVFVSVLCLNLQTKIILV